MSRAARLVDGSAVLARARARVTHRIAPAHEVDETGSRWTVHVPAEDVPCPDLATVRLPPRLAHLGTSGYSTRPGAVGVIDGARWSPAQGVVLDAAGRRLVHAQHGRDRPDLVRWVPLRRRPSRRVSDPLVTSLRAGRHNHLRTLVDQVSLFHVLAAARRGGLDEPVVVLHAGPLSAVEQHVLTPLVPDGVELRQVDGRTPIAVDRYLWVSHLTRWGLAGIPRSQLDATRAALSPRRPSRRDRLVLVSRADAAKGRGLADEDRVARRLGDLGFERVVLGRIPIAEQIELFHDARAVVAPHGAGLAHLLFADAVDVVELFPTPEVWPHYLLLSAVAGHRHRVLCGPGTHRHGAVEMDPDVIVDAAARALEGP